MAVVPRNSQRLSRETSSPSGAIEHRSLVSIRVPCLRLRLRLHLHLHLRLHLHPRHRRRMRLKRGSCQVQEGRTVTGHHSQSEDLSSSSLLSLLTRSVCRVSIGPATYGLLNAEPSEEALPERGDNDTSSRDAVDCALIPANCSVKAWTSAFKLSTSFLFCCHSRSTFSKLVSGVFLISLMKTLLAALRTAFAAFSCACATKKE